MGELPTPSLLIDGRRFNANVARFNRHLDSLGVPARPHLKTVKTIDLARRMLAGHPGGATVSTLAEAEYFFAAGITDLLYAVGIAPGRLARSAELIRRGLALTLVLDHADSAAAVVRAGAQHRVSYRVLLEVDADGQRAGFAPDDPELLTTAKRLADGQVTVAGVMVHAGGSYACRDRDCLVNMARRERDCAVEAAGRLRSAGHPIETVSVGSTPTALFAEALGGVSEVRAGVYATMDLVMAGLGVCAIEDIAMSVLTEVIGLRRRHGQVIVDAGWMALSRDRGTARQALDQGYGRVCDEAGRLLDPPVIVASCSQEHGLLTGLGGRPLEASRFTIGRRLRVLPNHACATGGQHDCYWWLSESDEPQRGSRCRGW